MLFTNARKPAYAKPQTHFGKDDMPEKITTQSFYIVKHDAEQVLLTAGYDVQFHHGKWRITAPWTWHKEGNGWQLRLPDGLHFYEDAYGTLHLD